MVGDICDEEELKTGYRAEGSFYSIFWWFIKMGTALASFVAGALIVLTMFDQTQVTKVDSIQGDIREMRAEVKYWQENKGFSTANSEWITCIKTQGNKALQESKDYLKYLDKESLKDQDEDHNYLPEYPSLRKTMLLNAKATTNATVTRLAQLLSPADPGRFGITNSAIDSLMKSAMILALQTKFEKAKMHSFELMSHLEARSARNSNSKEHYQVIIKNITGINNRISVMNTSLSPDVLNTELASIEGKIAPLTKQTPYTLLMMRVVEIGLPILLSLFSIFFLLRYTLTEKRSREIKELIMARNSKSTNNQNDL